MNLCIQVFLLSKLLLVVILILARHSNVDNLGTSISVLFKHCTLSAIICIGDTDTTTNDTFALVSPVIALVANTDNSLWVHKRVTNDTTTFQKRNMSSELHSNTKAWPILPSHLWHSRPTAIPGCLRQKIRSGLQEREREMLET